MNIILSVQEIRNVELGILSFFDHFCSENGLQYYLFYGSLLGAVRHHGFIPWDDDIDVIMPRDDYNKLCSLLSSENTIDKYKLLDNQIDPGFYLPFGKLIDVRTRLKEEYNINYDIGVGIDIFAFDNVGTDYKKAVRLYNKVQFIRNLADIKITRINRKRKFWKNITLLILQLFLMPVPVKRVLGIVLDIAHNETHQLTDGTLVANIVGGVYGKGEIHEKAWYESEQRVQFETITAMIPNNYDEILKKLYGNYMELPPIEKQKSHHMNTAYWRKSIE